MKKTNLITDKVLAEIKNINDKCYDLHLPAPPIQFINITVSNESGDIVEEYKSKSNSWVRNAYNFLAQIFLPCSNYDGASVFGAGSQSGKDIAGTTYRTSGNFFQPPSYQLKDAVYNSAANNNFGILVGTSGVQESFEHYNLQATIGNGTGAGQLSYQAMSAPVVTYNSTLKKWTSVLVRLFVNGSGSSITVREVGNAYYYNNGGASYYFLISRDVLTTPIEVANGQTLTVTYTSEITYPA